MYYNMEPEAKKSKKIDISSSSVRLLNDFAFKHLSWVKGHKLDI